MGRKAVEFSTKNLYFLLKICFTGSNFIKKIHCCILWRAKSVFLKNGIDFNGLTRWESKFSQVSEKNVPLFVKLVHRLTFYEANFPMHVQTNSLPHNEISRVRLIPLTVDHFFGDAQFVSSLTFINESHYCIRYAIGHLAVRVFLFRLFLWSLPRKCISSYF